MNRSQLSASDTVYDFAILGTNTHCALICNELASRGLSVLMLSETDLGEGASCFEKHFPLSAPHFFDISKKEIHQSLQKIHELAPIFAPRKRFLVSNMGLESLFSSFKLLAYEKLCKHSSDWKHYKLDRKALLIKEPRLDASAIQGTVSITALEINEQHLTLELCKNAIEHRAQLLNHTDLLQCELREGIFHLVLWDKVDQKQLSLQARKILCSKKQCYTEILGITANSAAEKNDAPFSFLQVSSEKFELKQNHFIQMGDRLFLASLSSGLLTFGVSSQLRDEEENHKTIIDCCYMLLGLSIKKEDILHSWKSIKKYTTSKEKEAGPNIFWIEDLHAEYAFYHKDKFLEQLGIKANPQTRQWKYSAFENTSPYSIVEACDSKFDEAKQTNISSRSFKKLFYRYGHDTEMITEYSYEYHRKYPTEEVWLRAEVRYCTEKELCCTAEDFFNRRSAIPFTPAQQHELKKAVEDEIAKHIK